MNQVGTRNSDHEPNPTIIDIRLTRDEDLIHSHNQGVQMPLPNGRISSHSTHMEESIERTIMPNMMPQLDGPASVCMQRRHPLPITRRTAIPDNGFPDDSNSNSHGYRSCENRGHPGGRRYHRERGGRPPNREDNEGQGYPGRGGPPDNGGPPDDGGPPVHPIIVQQPQVTLDTTVLENTFGTVGQSMLQLARAQDQTNQYLQEHLQQGQINMQAHTGALQQLATSTYQRNFDHIFASIPIYDGSNREDFFPWLERLETACFYSGRNIKTEA